MGATLSRMLSSKRPTTIFQFITLPFPLSRPLPFDFTSFLPIPVAVILNWTFSSSRYCTSTPTSLFTFSLSLLSLQLDGAKLWQGEAKGRVQQSSEAIKRDNNTQSLLLSPSTLGFALPICIKWAAREARLNSIGRQRALCGNYSVIYYCIYSIWQSKLSLPSTHPSSPTLPAK